MSKTAEIVRALTQTRRSTLAAFRMNPQTLRRAYAPGKWTGKQILGHLVDCELIFLVRTQFMLAEPEPAISPFDQEAWARRFAYERQNLKALQERFAALREALIALARSCTPADLRRRGNRPDRPDYTVGWLLEHAARHTTHHLDQLAAIQAGKTWLPKPK